MDANTQVLQHVLAQFSQDSPGTASSTGVRPNDSEVARSEKNILQWMSYLPEDCITTMIQLGWDVTT
jgi:hypothetical protein